MTEKASRKLLKHSCTWIKGHWDATNLEVPSDLLAKWIYEPNDEVVDPPGFHFGVFTFGYLQYQLLSKSVPSGQKESVPISLLLSLFQVWQMISGMANEASPGGTS